MSRAWRRVLVWAPHPDDEILAAAGVLQRARAHGAATRVTIATDGNAQPWVQRMIERRWSIGAAERTRWGLRRRIESRRGLARVGVDPTTLRFLELPDRGLTAALCSPRSPLVDALLDDLLRFRPTTVIAPALGDLHVDHAAMAIAARGALAAVGGTDAGPTVLTYVIHGRRPATGIALRLRRDEQDRKRAAILSHRSQLVHRRRWMLGFLPCETFLEPAPDPDRAADHPVRDLVVDGDSVIAHVEHGRPGGATLRLALEDAAGMHGFSVRLPPRTGLATVDGAEVLGGRCFAWCERGERHSLVELMTPAVAGARRWYARIDRGAGVFDRIGWREFAGAAPLASLSLRPDAKPAPSRDRAAYIDP